VIDYNRGVMTIDYESRALEKEGLTREEKLLIQEKKQCENFINQKLSEKEISKEAAEFLIWKLWNPYKGMDGTSVDEESINRPTFNPYFVNEKYLSVFKLVITNQGDNKESISINSLFIQNGDEQLLPIKTKQLASYHKDAIRPDMARRLNLPNDLVIFPGDTIVKYVAIDPISVSKGSFRLRYDLDEKFIEYEYTVAIKTRATEETKYKYTFKSDDFEYGYYINRYYFVLEMPDSSIVPLVENSIYLPKKYITKNVNVIGIAEGDDGFFYYQNTNVPINQSKPTIVIKPVSRKAYD
jgi:hypothetical protein